MPQIIGQTFDPFSTGGSYTGMPDPSASTPIIQRGASGVSPAGGMDLTTLTNYINQLFQKGQTDTNSARIPGNPGLETQSSKNIGGELKGQNPSDVLRTLQQQGAERGVATGTVGSANNDAAYLQALGLTSLDMTNLGQKNLTAADQRNPGAPLFDPATQLLTPYQTATLNNQGGGGGGPTTFGGGGGRGGGGAPAPWTATGGPSGTDVAYGATPAPKSGMPTASVPSFLDWWSAGGNAGATQGTGTSYFGTQQGYDQLFPAAQPPPGTVSTPTQSNYDPFAVDTGGDSSAFSIYGNYGGG